MFGHVILVFHSYITGETFTGLRQHGEPRYNELYEKLLIFDANDIVGSCLVNLEITNPLV